MNRVALVGLSLVALAALVWWLLDRERLGPAAAGAEPSEAAPEPVSLDAPQAPPQGRVRVPDAPQAAALEPVDAAPEAPVTPEAPRVLHGVVLDALDGRAIPGARIVLGKGSPEFPRSRPSFNTVEAETETGGDGSFRLEYAPRESTRLDLRPGWVLAEGYGPRSFVVESGHETPALAVRIELLGAAGLEVRVSDPEGLPQAGLEVEVRSREKPVFRKSGAMYGGSVPWSASTDEQGLAVFTGLPAEVVLEVVVNAGADPVARLELLALAPGERRRVECVHGLARILGRAVDPAGRSVPEFFLVMTASGQPFPVTDPRKAVAWVSGAWKPAGTVTDASGNFVFESVPYGSCLIGPSPEVASPYACRPQVVIVDRHEVEVLLALEQGLAIEGRVTNTGEDVQVHAWRRGAPREETLTRSPDAEGAFLFSGLAPGEYELCVRELPGLRSSEALTVTAGARSVELAMPESIRVRLRIPGVDEAQVRVSNAAHGGWILTHAEEGQAAVAVTPGRYSIVVSTLDERIGVAGLVVLAGDGSRELEIGLAPAATLTVVHAGDVLARTLRLSAGGVVLQELSLVPGAAETQLVPPGEVLAELLEKGVVVSGERVRLASGTRRRVALAPR